MSNEPDENSLSTVEKHEQTKSDFHNEGKPSPFVSNLTWGCVTVEGIGNFKDVKLYPGGAESWDWTKTDTHHQPGIQPGDVTELLDHHCQIIILSRGMRKMLHTSNETLQLLKDNQMKQDEDYFILQSDEAIELYNKYVHEQKRVGALIHSTC